MRVFETIGRAALCALALSSIPARADTDSDRGLIAIERPDEAFTRIRALPERIVEASEESKSRKPAPEAVQALSQAAAQSIDEAAMRNAVERAIAPLAFPGAPDLGHVAERWAAAGKTVEAAFDRDDEEAVTRKFKSDFDRRSDKAEIEAIVGAMAAPALDAELAVAAGRIERALELGQADSRAKLASADEGTRVALIEALMAEGRKQTADGGFSAGLTREAIVLHLRARLTLMSPDDLTALGAYYAAPAGRAKRDALVATFVEVAEASQRRMLRTYLETLRRTAR